MTALFIVTLVAIGILVAALAVYLVAIIIVLRDIRQTVGLILFGIRAISHRAQPTGEIVEAVNRDLRQARDRLNAVVGGPVPLQEPPGAIAQTKKPGTI